MNEEVIIKVDLQGDGSVDKLNKNIENISKNSSKASSEVLKMKSAFDVVNASLNVASASGDKFINKILSIRFPKVGEMAQKEVKILYEAFTKAEKIGSGMFDMASLAAKVFKNDMNQVNLAIASYNELFEKNTGVDGITLNTSALLALRNQVIATGGSVSTLNKEISSMTNESEKVSTFSGLMVNINNYIKDGVLDIGEFSKALNIARINGMEFSESLVNGIDDFNGSMDEVIENLNYLRSYRANPEEFFSDKGSGSEALEKQISEQQKLLTNTYILKDAYEGYQTSIQGLKDEVIRLTTEYSKLSAAERGAMPGAEMISKLKAVQSEIAKAEAPLNKLGLMGRTAGSNFDPLANSIMQVGRELPNFAISANIGFMAISNNLPILADAISDFKRMRDGIIAANKEAGAIQQTVPKMSDTIKKSLFSLGGAATILSGLFLIFGDKVIKGVIDWLNKIPESVKVKIEIDTEISKALEKNLISINKFVNDYRKASRDGNKERLEELEKFGKKEYDLNDARLKQIRYTTDGWKTAFKEYLKIAEDTYWNESIIKKKVEAQQTGKAALTKAQELYKHQKSKKGSALLGDAGFKWDTYVAMAYDGSFTESVAEALLVTGVDQQIVDELRAVNLQNQIIKGLPKLRDIDLKTGVSKPTGGTTTKQPINKLDTSLDKFNKPDLISIDNFYKPILDAEIKYTNEEIVIMNDNNKKRKGIYDDAIEDQIGYVIERESAIQRDINNELEAEYGKKSLLEAEVARFNDINDLYKDDVATLNDYARNKSNYQNLIILADKEMSSLGDKITQSDIDRINKKKQSYQDEIDIIDLDIAAKNKEIDTLKIQLKEYEGYPDKLAEITAKIAQLNVEITNSTRTQVEAERDLWQERVAMAKDYLDAISDVAGGIADIAQGNMDLTNAEYDRKIWANDEMIQSDEQREAKAYEIEMQRWEALQKNFEMQKKMKEAQAWMDFASGSVGIWTAPGITSLAPYGYILAGIQQAALLATTIGNVKSIKAQQMLKPHKGGSGSSGGSSSANIALNPAKDALTSRDENLNTMSKANLKDAPTQVVKVSEINDVQNKVKVREYNSTF